MRSPSTPCTRSPGSTTAGRRRPSGRCRPGGRGSWSARRMPARQLVIVCGTRGAGQSSPPRMRSKRLRGDDVARASRRGRIYEGRPLQRGRRVDRRGRADRGSASPTSPRRAGCFTSAARLRTWLRVDLLEKQCGGSRSARRGVAGWAVWRGRADEGSSLGDVRGHRAPAEQSVVGRPAAGDSSGPSVLGSGLWFAHTVRQVVLQVLADAGQVVRPPATPTARSCSAGPMPDSRNSWGEPIAPPQRITSRAAWPRAAPVAAVIDADRARPSTTRPAAGRRSRVRFRRSRAGCRYAPAALQRRPRAVS